MSNMKNISHIFPTANILFLYKCIINFSIISASHPNLYSSVGRKVPLIWLESHLFKITRYKTVCFMICVRTVRVCATFSLSRYFIVGQCHSVSAYMRATVYVCMCVCMSVYMCVCEYMCMYELVCTCMFVCVCECVCLIGIYLHICKRSYYLW